MQSKRNHLSISKTNNQMNTHILAKKTLNKFIVESSELIPKLDYNLISIPL